MSNRTGLAASRHFLDLNMVPAAQLRAIIDGAKARKTARAGLPKGVRDADAPLAGQALAMIFEKPSTRTRVSFDMAMRQLGGDSILLASGDMQLGRGESVFDTAQVLSRYVDAIMLRCHSHADLLELGRSASIPVINGLTDDSHPCQIMADVMTFEEHVGPIQGRKIAWCGDGNNVATSFIHAAAQFGFSLALACPKELSPNAAVLEWAQAQGADVRVTQDPIEAASGADAVVADTWLSMNDSDAARKARYTQLRPYQVNEALLARANDQAVFLHCLPAHRGEEATAAVMDSPQSVIFDEAENRLHVQKAILAWCLEG